MVTQYENIKVRFEYDMMRDLWRIWVILPPCQIHKPMHISMFPVADSKDAMDLAADIEYIPALKIGGAITSESLYHGGYTALGALFENGDYEDHPAISKASIAAQVVHSAKIHAQENFGFLAALTGAKPEDFTSASKAKAMLNAKMVNKKVDHGADLPNIIPGLLVRVKHPARPMSESRIFDIIQDLNDDFKWSRERVAEWLDTLDVDLSFPMVDEDG